MMFAKVYACRIFVVFVLTFVFIGCAAPKHIQMTPITLSLKDGKVFYEKVIQFQDVPKKELFMRGRIWAVNVFRDAKQVLQIEDEKNGQLTGKGIFYLSTDSYHPVEFTFNIQYKENKYLVQFYDFILRSINPVAGTEIKRSITDVYENYLRGTAAKEVFGNQKAAQQRDWRYLFLFQNKVRALAMGLYSYEVGKHDTGF